MIGLLHLVTFSLCIAAGSTSPAVFQRDGSAVSVKVFESLEELARIVDISYCVGSTGIHKPFCCLSRCNEFEGFELVTTWNTGPLLSDSCGYIALSHAPYERRIIVAFRGTYSIANTIADLSTIPAEYAPFPGNEDRDSCQTRTSTDQGPLLPQLLKGPTKREEESKRCTNCTVHSGFMTSWRNTRCTIIPEVEQALQRYPDYNLVLVGHSLGGAVAALAGLEFQARGWNPQVTTFGEPKIGNHELTRFLDWRFNLNSTSPDDALYRRVTHVDDPVPLLPLQEWGYRMHAGEIYISRSSIPPERADLQHCSGDEDPSCIASGEITDAAARSEQTEDEHDNVEIKWGIPKRYKLWQLFFAHRDYFWRLGLCVPPGYPWDWNRDRSDNRIMGDDEL